MNSLLLHLVQKSPVRSLNISTTNFGSGNLLENSFSNSGTLNNSGAITNGFASTINNTGLIINAGTLNNEGALNNAGIIANSGKMAISTTGLFTNNGTLTSAGLLTNEGLITNASGAFFNNMGRIINTSLGGGFVNSGMVNNSTGAFFGNDNGLVVNSYGAQFNNYGTFENVGQLNNAGTFTNVGTLIQAEIFTNTGTLTNSGTIKNTGIFTSSGIVKISNMGLFTTSTNYTQTAGSTMVDGTLTATSGATVKILGGTLSGTGTIDGNIIMAGTMMPGDAPGTLAIFGNYEQTGTGIFDELMASGSQSFLDVSDNLVLDPGASLEISLLDGFDPLGRTISIMDFSTLSGQFANGSSFWDENYLWDITYRQHEIEVTAVKAPEPGTFFMVTLGLIGLLYSWRKKVSFT